MDQLRENLNVDGLLLVLFLATIAVPLNLQLHRLLTVYTFDLALAAAGAVWLIRAMRGSARRPQLGAIDAAFWLMMLWSAVATIMGTGLAVGTDRFLFLVRAYLICLFVVEAATQSGNARFSVALLLGLVAVEGTVCIIQYVTKTSFGSIPDLVGTTVGTVRVARGQDSTLAQLLFRARGTLGYDTALGQWFELLVPIPLSIALWTRDRRLRLASASVAGLGFVGLVFTFTRGAWLGFFVSTLVLFLWLLSEGGVEREKLVTAGRVVVVLGLAMALLLVPIRARLFSDEAIENSVLVRVRLIQRASAVIRQSPIAGAGLGVFEQQVRSSSGRLRARARQIHNMYLMMATETGIVGLLLFVAVLGLAAQELYRLRHSSVSIYSQVGGGLLAGFAGVLCHGMVSWGFLSYQVLPLFWVLLGIATALRRLSPPVVQVT